MILLEPQMMLTPSHPEQYPLPNESMTDAFGDEVLSLSTISVDAFHFPFASLTKKPLDLFFRRRLGETVMHPATTTPPSGTGSAHGSTLLLSDPSFWFTVFLLLVIVFFCGFYGRSCGERIEDYESESTAHRTTMSKEEIRQTLEKHKMVVKREDLVNDEDMEKLIRSFGVEADEENQETPHFLVLPVESPVEVPCGDDTNEKDAKSEQKSDEDDHDRLNHSHHPQGRMIPNNCAICLAVYSPGDDVTWSANLRCPHAFHEECILQWLAVKRRPTCPCCRRNFLKSSSGGADIPATAAAATSPSSREEAADAAEGMENNEATHRHSTSTLRLEWGPRLRLAVSFYGASSHAHGPNASAHLSSQVIPLHQADEVGANISNIYDGLSGQSFFCSLPPSTSSEPFTNATLTPRRSSV